MTGIASNDESHPPPKLHPSVPSHLQIELSMLAGLIQRSKHQHRSQKFYCQMKRVCRLGTLVGDTVSEPATQTFALTSKDRRKTDKLLSRFVDALTDAAYSTRQIIELRHFLPLQITLLAVYSRLFTITASICEVMSLDIEGVMGGKWNSTFKKPVQSTTSHVAFPNPSSSSKVTLEDMELGVDVGETIAREDRSSGVSTPSVPVPTSQHVLIEEPPVPDSAKNDVQPAVVHPPPSPLPAQEPLVNPPSIKRKKEKDEPELKAKRKKKRNIMDDIFG